MKVICRQPGLSATQWEAFGLSGYTFQFDVEVGRIYTVLGICSGREIISGTLLDLPGEHYVQPAPLCLFDVIDERPSRYWLARKDEKQILTLWPEEFYIEGFRRRLGDFDPELLPSYRALCARIEHEFD